MENAGFRWLGSAILASAGRRLFRACLSTDLVLRCARLVDRVKLIGYRGVYGRRRRNALALGFPRRRGVAWATVGLRRNI